MKQRGNNTQLTPGDAAKKKADTPTSSKKEKKKKKKTQLKFSDSEKLQLLPNPIQHHIR